MCLMKIFISRDITNSVYHNYNFTPILTVFGTYSRHIKRHFNFKSAFLRKSYSTALFALVAKAGNPVRVPMIAMTAISIG